MKAYIREILNRRLQSVVENSGVNLNPAKNRAGELHQASDLPRPPAPSRRPLIRSIRLLDLSEADRALYWELIQSEALVFSVFGPKKGKRITFQHRRLSSALRSALKVTIFEWSAKRAAGYWGGVATLRRHGREHFIRISRAQERRTESA